MVGRTKSLLYSKPVREQKNLEVSNCVSFAPLPSVWTWLSLKVCAQETYGAKVNDEAVALVEAVPAERNLRGPDHSPALHMQESLRCQVVGENVV